MVGALGVGVCMAMEYRTCGVADNIQLPVHSLQYDCIAALVPTLKPGP